MRSRITDKNWNKLIPINTKQSSWNNILSSKKQGVLIYDSGVLSTPRRLCTCASSSQLSFESFSRSVVRSLNAAFRKGRRDRYSTSWRSPPIASGRARERTKDGRTPVEIGRVVNQMECDSSFFDSLSDARGRDDVRAAKSDGSAADPRWRHTMFFVRPPPSSSGERVLYKCVRLYWSDCGFALRKFRPGRWCQPLWRYFIRKPRLHGSIAIERLRRTITCRNPIENVWCLHVRLFHGHILVDIKKCRKKYLLR